MEVDKINQYRFNVVASSEKDAIIQSINAIQSGKVETVDGSIDFDFKNIELVGIAIGSI